MLACGSTFCLLYYTRPLIFGLLHSAILKKEYDLFAHRNRGRVFTNIYDKNYLLFVPKCETAMWNVCCHWLFVNPWTVAHQAPLFMEFSRQKYWSGLPFPTPRGSSWPRDRTHISCIGRQILYHWATWEAHCLYYLLINEHIQTCSKVEWSVHRNTGTDHPSSAMIAILPILIHLFFHTLIF